MFAMGPGFRVSAGGAGAAVTWNPADKSANLTLSGGNLVVTKTAGGGTHDGTARATSSKSTGKFYWEVLVNTVAAGNEECAAGIANASAPLTNYIGVDANGWGYVGVNGFKYHGGSGTSFGNTYTDNDVVMVALDMTAGNVWFGKNGVWQGSGSPNPATGTAPAFTGITGSIFPACDAYDASAKFTARFLAASWSYTAPSGFVAMT